MAKYADSDHKLVEELQWLKARQDKMRPHDGMDYIRILRKHPCWADLVELPQIPLPNGYTFLLADYLSESKDISHVKIGLNLCQKLIDKGGKRRSLHFNLGVAQWKLGDFEKANPGFIKKSISDAFRSLLLEEQDANSQGVTV